MESRRKHNILAASEHVGRRRGLCGVGLGLQHAPAKSLFIAGLTVCLDRVRDETSEIS